MSLNQSLKRVASVTRDGGQSETSFCRQLSPETLPFSAAVAFIFVALLLTACDSRPQSNQRGDTRAAVPDDAVSPPPSSTAIPTPSRLQERDRTRDRPNVLFIAIDDLNDWVGCLGGHPQAKTPHIDRLAKRGVLFTNAHCQAPICNPSRTSLLTGVLPSTSGIYLNGLGGNDFRNAPTLRDVVTLPEHFGQNGYHTIGVGKVFHGGTPHPETFHVYGPLPGHGPLPEEKISYPTGLQQWDWGAYPATDGEMYDAQVARWAVEQIDSKHDAPFFLAAGFYRPHVPMYAPPKWFNIFPRETIQLPPVKADDRDDLPDYAIRLTSRNVAPRHEWMITHDQWRHAIQAYLASTAFVDHCVGKLLDTLDQSQHADDTLIVLFSDHGFHLGEKQRWAKGALWERATKVPLIVVPPKSWDSESPSWARGKTCNQPVGLIDLYPTLAALCGLPARDGLEGHSLDVLLKRPDVPWPHTALTTFHPNNHAVRSERWRYIRYADESEELYDHRTDPNEWHNLAGKPEYAEVVAEHKRLLPKVNLPVFRSP